MTTWKDIKLATLQKMFSSNGTTIQIDSSTQEYIYSMPQAANEGLQLLSTAGKFIIKPWTVNNFPFNNMLGNGYENRRYDASAIYETKGAHSYYFEIMGKVTCTLRVGETIIPIHSEDDTLINSPDKYTTFKASFDNDNDEDVSISFNSEYPFNIRNICFYKEKFLDVPMYREYLKFNLKELIPDFYQISETDIYLETDTEPRYLAASNYYQEADNTLVIPRADEGVYTVYYKAYPGEITLNTPDDYEMALDPEVAAILPLYMASQLYKDDDLGTSTVYRNEWEVAFERLTKSVSAPSSEHFTSVSGWI
jgi:hypothetical protein